MLTSFMNLTAAKAQSDIFTAEGDQVVEVGVAIDYDSAQPGGVSSKLRWTDPFDTPHLVQQLQEDPPVLQLLTVKDGTAITLETSVVGGAVDYNLHVKVS